MRWNVVALACILVGALGAEQKIEGPLVLLIGPPGSGKSTQGVRVARKWRLPLVSVEELIADNQDAIRKLRASGVTGIEPETDPVINQFFEERLKRGDLTKGAVLDGYPSTKDHGDFLTRMVQAGQLPDPVVIQLEISDEEVRKRMAKVPGRNMESVEQRLKDYHREMDMVRLYFPNADITSVDGSKKPKRVNKNINKLLKSKLKK